MLSRAARELGVAIIAPLYERDGVGNYYNTAAVIDADGTLLGTYRKCHIPDDPYFYEGSYFQVGNLGYRVFKTRYISLGVLICYDQWFPEAARISTLKGADILFYPSAIGYLENDPSSRDWHDAWETVQRSHAIANGVHVAAVNRVGKEGQINFWGSSFVCDSFGRLLKRATEHEEVLVVEIDPSKNRTVREGWGFLKNRRPETYSSLVSHKTPRELGYAMPAEWEKHRATWMAWPHDPVTFPNRVERVEGLYLQIIGAISESEDINLFVTDTSMKTRVIQLLKGAGTDLDKISLHVWDYADVWFRDYGPIFVVDRTTGEVAMVHWIFDAWGRKYEGLMKDAQIPFIMNQAKQLSCFEPGIVLEGGSVDVNGKGTLLTTEQCLQTRNRHLAKEDIERYLIDYFNVSKIIWLRGGIAGDDTDGHIDNLARFVDPGTVLCAYEDDEKDENYSILKENYEMLLESSDQDGNRLKVVKLPMPGYVGYGSKRLPASYLNFYILNGLVLVPIFGHRNDRRALDAVQGVFSGRKVVGLNCVDLVHGLGTIHCITQQEPSPN